MPATSWRGCLSRFSCLSMASLSSRRSHRRRRRAAPDRVRRWCRADRASRCLSRRVAADRLCTVRAGQQRAGRRRTWRCAFRGLQAITAPPTATSISVNAPVRRAAWKFGMAAPFQCSDAHRRATAFFSNDSSELSAGSTPRRASASEPQVDVDLAPRATAEAMSRVRPTFGSRVAGESASPPSPTVSVRTCALGGRPRAISSAAPGPRPARAATSSITSSGAPLALFHRQRATALGLREAIALPWWRRR